MIPNYYNTKGTPVVDMPALIETWKHSGKLLNIYVQDVFREINKQDSPCGKIRDKCMQEIYLFLRRRITDGSLDCLKIPVENLQEGKSISINKKYTHTHLVNGLAEIFEKYQHVWFAKVYEDQGEMNSHIWYFNPYSQKYSFSHDSYIRNSSGNVICLYPIEFITGAWYSAKSNKNYRKDTLEYLRPYEKFV